MAVVLERMQVHLLKYMFIQLHRMGMRLGSREWATLSLCRWKIPCHKREGRYKLEVP